MIWKISRQPKTFLDYVSRRHGNFPDYLESFETTWKISRQPGKFLLHNQCTYRENDVHTFWSIFAKWFTHSVLKVLHGKVCQSESFYFLDLWDMGGRIQTQNRDSSADMDTFPGYGYSWIAHSNSVWGVWVHPSILFVRICLRLGATFFITLFVSGSLRDALD